MKKTAILISILVSPPIAFGVLVFIVYFWGIPIPVGGDVLYEDQQGVNKIVGDQLIGGGYIFPPDNGRDVWMRVHTTANLSDESLFGISSTCSSKNFKKIQAWFIQRVTTQKQFGLIPMAGSSQVDQAVLEDDANLRCGGGIADDNVRENLFGKSPEDCITSWVLYHKPSGFYYKRVSCIF